MNAAVPPARVGVAWLVRAGDEFLDPIINSLSDDRLEPMIVPSAPDMSSSVSLASPVLSRHEMSSPSDPMLDLDVVLPRLSGPGSHKENKW